MEGSRGQDAAAERRPPADPGDPYEVEHSGHRPLPPEPASPSARAPTHPTRIELPRGRRICLAVTHDASAARVVRYAAKLLLKSPEDRVHLLHVQQKGQCPKGTGGSTSGTTPTMTPYGSAGGMSLLGSGPLPSLGLHTLRSAPVFAAPPATPEEHPGPGSYERGAVLPPGQPMSPRHSLPPPGGFALGSPAGGSLDMGSWGSVSGLQVAALGSPPGQEACEVLLERCRLQLLAESRRVQPDHVAVQLLPLTKSPEKCIRNFCKQERCDILVVGCRGHVAKSNKLLSFIGQGGGSVGAYCEGHLPDTRVVVLPALGPHS